MTRAQRSYYVWVQVFPHVTLSIVENAFSFLSTVGCYVTCNICYILLLDNSRCWVTFSGRVILFAGVELCWNVYPSNLHSSALLLGLHLIILFGLWSAPSEYPYVDKKVSTQDKHKWSYICWDSWVYSRRNCRPFFWSFKNCGLVLSTKAVGFNPLVVFVWIYISYRLL